jgi:hypothetical protein
MLGRDSCSDDSVKAKRERVQLQNVDNDDDDDPVEGRRGENRWATDRMWQQNERGGYEKK